MKNKKIDELEIKTIDENTKKHLVDFYNKNTGETKSSNRKIEHRIALNVQSFQNYLSRGKNSKKK
jgi:hypothetical protein